jgi:hypothetical protein
MMALLTMPHLFILTNTNTLLLVDRSGLVGMVHPLDNISHFIRIAMSHHRRVP